MSLAIYRNEFYSFIGKLAFSECTGYVWPKHQAVLMSSWALPNMFYFPKLIFFCCQSDLHSLHKSLQSDELRGWCGLHQLRPWYSRKPWLSGQVGTGPLPCLMSQGCLSSSVSYHVSATWLRRFSLGNSCESLVKAQLP